VKTEMKSVAYADDDVAVSDVMAPFSLWSETLGSLTAALAALMLETTAALAAVAEETAVVKAKGSLP
jgi:hypothetical protein